jgi:hypothetical protein
VGAGRAIRAMCGKLNEKDIPGKYSDINNPLTNRIELASKGVSLLNKFIICLSQIAEFDPAQPAIPN